MFNAVSLVGDAFPLRLCQVLHCELHLIETLYSVSQMNYRVRLVLIHQEVVGL